MKGRNTQDDSMEIGDGIRVVHTTIDKKFAEDLLAKNSKNRPLSAYWVWQIKQSLQTGRYRFIGDTFVVGKSGALLDGQHRCEAVRQCGIPIEHALMVIGVDDHEFDKMGRVKARCASDTIGASQEFQYHKEVASAASWSMRYELKDGHSLPTQKEAAWAPYEVLQYCRENRTIEDSAREAVKLRQYTTGWLPTSILTFLHFGARKHGSGTMELANQFAHNLATGTGDGVTTDTGIWLYRDRLMRENAEVTRIPAELKVALGIKAWNSFFEGAVVKLLRFGPTEKFPSFA